MENYAEFADEQLLLLVKERDRLAFTELYQRHWQLVYLHAYNLLADADEAKDLVQDVFFAFWEKADELNVSVNLKGYLYKAMRNRIFSLIRRRKVSDQFVSLLMEELDGLDNATVEAIEERELLALIDAEIARLPAKMREVFELSRKSFLTQKEIAERLGMSEEAVKKQIHRALRLLRAKLGRYAGFYVLLLASA
ncbi:RNA polymerase sigma-70 factor, ECF subfamily [Parapedobacter composti]|uniref:RNA polymerase sigma-70 factor, ECF subfamily n=1 Tax=Parapedobacter composti TaxID=623281 RepID=A0A1I1KZA5_9SPHI|nr:RNA polymerase sigma-70 factor [Parapedobacter composti]SFC65622.1 RNA polymerase sigma-70 factor, ECF subfamily [Parapedobacter composti]